MRILFDVGYRDGGCEASLLIVKLDRNRWAHQWRKYEYFTNELLVWQANLIIIVLFSRHWFFYHYNNQILKSTKLNLK